MSNQPGWQPDPYGRYEQRYYDGAKWTEHVANAGAQLIDPMGTTLAIPFVRPSVSGPVASAPATTGVPAASADGHSPTDSAGGAPVAHFGAAPDGSAATAVAPAGGSGTGGWRGFLDGLGPDARQRPRPDVTIALAGIGGAVAAAGLLALSVDSNSFDGLNGIRGKLAVYSIVVLVVAYAIRLFVKGQFEARSAAVGAGAVGTFGLGAAIAYTSSSQTAPLLLLTGLYLAAWILPGLRGRPLILGLSALTLVAAIAGLADNDQVNARFGGGGGTGQGITFLLMGAGLLCFVFLLDRDGYSGVATGLLVAGLISTVAGAFQVVGNLNSAGGSFLLALVGVAVCIVGTHGTRRASVWIGAALTALGVVAFVVAVVKPGSVSSASGALIGAAAILIGGPLVFELVRANRDQRESSGGTPSNASTTAATASQPTAPPAAPGSNLPPPPG